MPFEFHHESFRWDPPGVGRALAEIIRQGRQIMATQAELVAQLTAATDELKKASAEVATQYAALMGQIADLKKIVDAQATVSPELQAAVDAIVAQSKVVDDLTPDPVVTPPTP